MMKVFTKKVCAQDAPDRWAQQYSGFNDEAKSSIGRKLYALKERTPDAVNQIIGNTSWTEVPKCYECGKDSDKTIMIGEEPDYESNTTYVCLPCLEKAVKLMRQNHDD